MLNRQERNIILAYLGLVICLLVHNPYLLTIFIYVLIISFIVAIIMYFINTRR